MRPKKKLASKNHFGTDRFHDIFEKIIDTTAQISLRLSCREESPASGQQQAKRTKYHGAKVECERPLHILSIV